MAIRGSPECRQRCLSICLSGHLSLWSYQPYLYSGCTPYFFFFMIFTFFVESHLLGNTKLSFLVLWFKSYRPCRERALHFLHFSLFFAFFVENRLLGNTKLSFLVLWFKSYGPCRQRALYFSLFLDSLLKVTY